MKMYMDHSQEVGEVGCREEVVQGTDSRDSVLYKALSCDGASVSFDLRCKSSGHLSSANVNGVARHNSLHHGARLTDKPVLRALLSSNGEVATPAPCGAAVASGRRADPVGGRRYRRIEGSTTSSASVSHLPDGVSGVHHHRRSVPLLAQHSRVKNLPNGICNGSSFSNVTTTAVVDPSSLGEGMVVLTVPPTSRPNLLASPSRLRHRPKSSVAEVGVENGSAWRAVDQVREVGAPTKREVVHSLDSWSDEDYQPDPLHFQQQHHSRARRQPKPDVFYQPARETFDVQGSRVLVINGIVDESNGYIIADSHPFPLSSSSLSIHPVYPNLPDAVEMRLDHDQGFENPDHSAVEGSLSDCSEVEAARRYQRSLSDESSYCSSNSSGRSTVSGDDAVADNRTIIYHPQSCIEEVISTECAPLDLSTGRRGRRLVDGNIKFHSDDGGFGASVALVVDKQEPLCLANDNSPPNPLMQLADACSFVLENETQRSLSYESSPPSSLSDSNSCHSVYKEEALQVPSVSTYYTPQEYLTESQENSLDNCVSLQVQELSDIKYEISDDFQPGGIILNSNVLGDRVFHDSKAFGLQQIEVRSDDDKVGVLREVANLTVDDGYSEDLYRSVYTNNGTVSTTPSMEECNNSYCGSQDSNSGSECSSFTARSLLSSSRITIGSGMATSVICTSGGGDNKKRLRLGKAEYESMSEQDRKIRHRVLDNQRSKQYRERRRRMIASLQCNIATEEGRNKGLRENFDRMEKQLSLVKEAMIRVKMFANSTVLVPTPQFVKAEC